MIRSVESWHPTALEKVGYLTIDAAESHARSSAYKGGEGLAVGSDKLTSLSRVILLLVEVKDKVLIAG